MPARTIRVFADVQALSEAAAHEWVRCGREAVAARGRFTVALSGGSTPKRLYQLLAAEPFRSQVDWSRVEIFWGDERCVPPDHADSNYRMAREAMLAHLPIPAEHIHRIEAERADHDAAARDYEAVLSSRVRRCRRRRSRPLSICPPGHGAGRPHRVAVPAHASARRDAPLGRRQSCAAARTPIA